ncbi:MAG: hypothetical protein IPG67_16540 [Acidobacteria bacterium]|nr:hypothetical protein [Acidobacteriota bacterium]
MQRAEPTFLSKLRSNLPWLVRYPGSRAASLLEQTAFEHKHIIFTIANHFEPGWSDNGILDHKTQIARLKAYHKTARETGEAVRDMDGTKFRHTNFYPAEQYHPEIIDIMAEMQAEGLGEVEIHLHHGVERPDTAENLRKTLIGFRDTLADEHRCLSRMDGRGDPMYAFVHGNLALANSAAGKFCGVDNEMAILRDTGCYADLTLPSAPDETQVPLINQIYEYEGDPELAVPHSRGRRVGVNGKQSVLPLIITGPLTFDYTRLKRGLPVPRIEDGSLTEAMGTSPSRLRRWTSTNITVAGKPDWIFVKLYCHGFFDRDQSACIGEDARRFFGGIIEESERSGKRTIHFASARELFNMASAAVDGKTGSPNEHRDYRLKAIMQNV